MNLAFLAIGVLIGAALGFLAARLFGRQTGMVSGEVHGELAKAEAAAKQLAKSLESERDAFKVSLESARSEGSELTRKLATAEANIPQLETAQQTAKTEVKKFQDKIEEQQTTISNLTIKATTAESERTQLAKQITDQEERFKTVMTQSKTEFENLANQILETKSKKLTEQSTKDLDSVLNPLKEKIAGFEKQVKDSYSTEERERFALKKEIERLIGLNERMTLETNALTQALKGDSKTQGDWGEMILEKILEASGLREGHEFSQQKHHEGQEGGRFYPDIVINLPDGKHIIVDSKVSLTAYELHCRTDEGEMKIKALDSHIKSLHGHIDDLAEKHYTKLKGMNSPEFVFMFVPIEPAYLAAMRADADLSTKAWKKGVAIVTATTLLTSLKTVQHIWRVENQNKNAMEIASEGGKLYDKFVGFMDDFEKIGKIFETGQMQFTTAMGKLKVGPGNVFKKMELLRELGAAPTKRIKAEHID